MRMNAADTSASSAIADCTPLAVVSRSSTTAEIDTFINDVSTTSTNIAAASKSINRRLPDSTWAAVASPGSASDTLASDLAAQRPDGDYGEGAHGQEPQRVGGHVHEGRDGGEPGHEDGQDPAQLRLIVRSTPGMVVMPNDMTPAIELTSYRFGPVSLIAASLSGRASRSRGQRSGVASGGEGVAQPVEHGLLAVADLLGTEAHEPAVLGRVGGGLGGGGGGRQEPTSESRGLLRCGACGDQGLHCLELVDDLVSRRSGAAGL